MAEEPTRRRRGRRPKAGGGTGGGSIDWAQLEVALGYGRVSQLQHELRVKAQQQIAAGEAILRSLNTTTTAPKKRRRQTQRTITDPVVLENRRLALAKAREALAERRRQEAANGAVQDLTGAGATG